MMKRLLIPVLAAAFVSVGGFATLAQTAKPATPPVNLPICDRTHADECLQLGQNRELDRQIDQAYPKCARLSGARKAGCVNQAMAK